MADPPTGSDKEIRQILRRRTKRSRTSCFPCRKRKVKCDKCSPCDNCAKGGYPELCSFTGPSEIGEDPPAARVHPARASEHQPAYDIAQQPSLKRTRYDTAHSESSMLSDGQDMGSPACLRDTRADIVSDSNGASWLRPGNNLSTSAQQVRVEAHHGEHEQREPFLGTNSMPAFLRDENSQVGSVHDSPSHTVEDAILPILGLKEPESTYPFLPDSEASLERIRSELYQILPLDHEIISIFQRYKLSAHSFTPIIPDIEEFEVELCQYLEERAFLKRQSYLQNPGTHAPEIPRSVSWVGSLLAVLASGAQYTQNSSQERQAKSRLYARHSFQCLRVANFLVRPSLLCIQTLLILGNVLQTDMKPEAAWMLLGTTARMAQSLGLHENRTESDSPGRKLWQALVWQDSLLSLCFDRPPITTPSRFHTQPADGIPYQDAMNLLCDRTLRSIRNRANGNPLEFIAILEDVAGIEDIHWKSIANTETPSRLGIRQRSEISALSLHTSFVIAWLCRPALRNRPNPESRTEIQLLLTEKCKKNLTECIRAFVHLHSLNNLASRSWPVIHNGLSSALLLGLLGATNTNPEVRQVQGEILEILSSESEKNGREQGFGGDIELSAPHARALTVLRRLYNNHAVDPAPGNSFDGGRRNQENQFQPALNAANALQRDIFDADFSNVMDIPELNSIGPDFSEMSPFEMFNSIIWDPVNVEGSAPDYNLSASEPWIF